MSITRARATVLSVSSYLLFQSVCICLAAGQDTTTIPPAASHSTLPGVKTLSGGSIRDIEAIGYRKVGCGRGIRNWYSLERQMEMGKDSARDVEAVSKLITDPLVTTYINELRQYLVRNSDSHVPFTFKVIDSDEVNAFALPGGFFFVNYGLILAADNEAELAGVMAHEIAHVAACHAARSRTRGQLLNFVSVPLMVVGGPLGSALYEALSVAAPIMLMTFTRRFESEADFLAVQYMYKAGYDPQALAGFLERISSLESTTDDPVTKAFSSHPEMVQRIERIQREIASLLPARPEYKVDTSEFQEVKLRLSQAEQRTGAPAQGMFVPTLKRRSAPPELHLY